MAVGDLFPQILVFISIGLVLRCLRFFLGPMSLSPRSSSPLVYLLLSFCFGSSSVAGGISSDFFPKVSNPSSRKELRCAQPKVR